MKKIILYLAVAFGVISCKPKYAKEGISVNVDDAIDVQLEEVATNIRVFPIVCDNPMKEIGVFQIYGDEMLAMDASSQLIYYLKDFKVQKVLNSVGRGRGEYLSLNYMLYDKERKILYLTQNVNGTTILKYSIPDMGFLGAIESPYKVSVVRFYDRNTFLASMKTEEDVNGLYLFDIGTEQVIKKICDLSSYQYQQSNNGLMNFEEDRHWISLFGPTNKLCNYSNDSLEVLMSLNYGEMDADYIYDMKAITSKDVEKITKFLAEGDKYFVNFYYPRMYEDGVSFWYSSFREKQGNYRYYRVTKNKEIHYKGFHISGLKIPVYPACSYGNGYAFIIQGSLDDIKDPSVTPSPLAKKILNVLSEQTDDNPVIVLFDI